MTALLAGQATQQDAVKVERFLESIGSKLEDWIRRIPNPSTQRAYRKAVMDFIEFLGIDWPTESREVLSATVTEVRDWRDELIALGRARATCNARLSALSGFYRFLGWVAEDELDLPVQVPNPANAQLIGRGGSEAVHRTAALKLSKARRLLELPSRRHILRQDGFLARRYKAGAPAIEEELDVLVARDRAILATFLYTGALIHSVCALRVGDVIADEDDPALNLRQKGRVRRVGIHFVCAEALIEYLARSGLTEGALFRARANPRSAKLSSRPMSSAAMYRLVRSYLECLRGAMVEEKLDDGSVRRRCRYSPQSLRVTTATLLHEAGVSIQRIQELLGHRDIRVTEACVKAARNPERSASHDVRL